MRRHRSSGWAHTLLRIIFWGFIAIVCIGGILLFVSTRTTSELARVNVLVGSSPVTMWSWNRVDDSFVIVVLPAHVAADAPEYGRYSLDALWKLGHIDKKAGSVLATALGNTLALPIPWYVAQKADILVTTDNPQEYGKTVFSLRNAPAIFLRQWQTNMPVGLFISITRALQRVQPDDIVVHDFTKPAPVGVEALPDGSRREFFDMPRIDELLKGYFEDEQIRAEGITVGVDNTTTTPALGTQAARVLSNEGVLVVSVGNAEPAVGTCVVEGSESMIKTKTARVIAEIFNCVRTVSATVSRVDLRVLLGTDYAARFVTGK
jgi:hypothetical protein